MISVAPLGSRHLQKHVKSSSSSNLVTNVTRFYTKWSTFSLLNWNSPIIVLPVWSCLSPKAVCGFWRCTICLLPRNLISFYKTEANFHATKTGNLFVRIKRNHEISIAATCISEIFVLLTDLSPWLFRTRLIANVFFSLVCIKSVWVTLCCSWHKYLKISLEMIATIFSAIIIFWHRFSG